MPKLNLDRDQVDSCRDLAEKVVRPVSKYIDMHSSVAVERATLRLLGFEGEHALENGQTVELVNAVVDKLGKERLKHGVAVWVAAIKKSFPKLEQSQIADKILKDQVNLDKIEFLPEDKAKLILKPWIDSSIRHLDRMRHQKEEKRGRRSGAKPNKSVLVATGDVREDARQAVALARAGADVIVVVRSSAQSLLDYVPRGETTEGFHGTFFTPENLSLMRAALDEVSSELKRYVRLAVSAQGLCAPEMAVMAALAGVDEVEHDALYGPIYRDINMKRSFVDQHFVKSPLSRAGVVTTTSEANLSMAFDPHTAHPQMIVSHFINEQLVRSAGLRDDTVGFSHAFLLDQPTDQALSHQLAMAQLMREVFPRSPIRYMIRSTVSSRISGAKQALYTLIGGMTGQNTQLVGDPRLNGSLPMFQEQFYHVRQASAIMAFSRIWEEDMQFANNGTIMRRAKSIMEMAFRHLLRVKNRGLFESLENGLFGDVRRHRDGGVGLDGVFQTSRKYFNPFG
jgi:beta-lysine 5,6-aminomutase alpha subunit